MNLNDDSSLTATMAAKIEIEELADHPAREKEIRDAVTALNGILATSVVNGALHVSYDPLATSEKKIEGAVRSAGGKVKSADTDTETPHP